MMDALASDAIAARCNVCSNLFNQLSDVLRSTHPDSPYRIYVTDSAVQDEIGRFRVWLGNVGAHRSGRVSLDYRLREAAHMRDSVLDLLKDLEDNINEGQSHTSCNISE